MKLTRGLSPLLLAMAVALFALTISGCGDSEDATGEEPSQAYAEILAGMKQAAVADATFSASRKALDLSVPEREVIRAFCETAWQLEINSEGERLKTDAYLIDRVRGLAEYELNGKFREEIGVAMAELREDLDLVAIDPQLNHKYKKACYLKPSQAKKAEQAGT
jgi:hypothetical protein